MNLGDNTQQGSQQPLQERNARLLLFLLAPKIVRRAKGAFGQALSAHGTVRVGDGAAEKGVQGEGLGAHPAGPTLYILYL